MKHRPDHCDDFLAHRPIAGVTFEHDDFVEVVAGEHKGKKGNLVNIAQLTSDPLFILELESGHDIHVRQSDIQRHGS